MSVTLILMVTVLSLFVSLAFRVDPVSAAQSCGNVDTVILSCGSENAVWSILEIVMNILAIGVGIVAVGGIAYAALLYASSNDDTGQVAKAKDGIRNVVIGVVAFAFLYPVAQFLIPGGIFDRELTTISSSDPNTPLSIPNVTEPGNETNNSPASNKKAVIRIGVYNAASVTEPAGAHISNIRAGMAEMKSQKAEIVSLQEISSGQASWLKSNTDWEVYRSDSGNRGVAIAYSKNNFTPIGRGGITISRSSASVDCGGSWREPIMTLERKKDKARITVIAVHLIAKAGGLNCYNTYQPIQQKIIRDEAIKLGKDGTRAVVAAGDFNWFFDDSNGWMLPMESRGDRVMRIFKLPDMRYSSFTAHGLSVTDHDLISGDVETKWFGK